MKDDPQDEHAAAYCVVLNHEAQYSIWPTSQKIPTGWKKTGKTGTRTDCLALIEETWTDMRPLSLRSMLNWSEQTRGDTKEIADRQAIRND